VFDGVKPGGGARGWRKKFLQRMACSGDMAGGMRSARLILIKQIHRSVQTRRSCDYCSHQRVNRAARRYLTMMWDGAK
jgi:hypothetical protein